MATELAVEDNEFPPPPQPLTATHNPQQLAVLIDTLLAPWSKRTALDLQRAARRERKARQRSELQVRLRIVIVQVEKLFRLSPGALNSERRTSRIAMARHIAYYLCHTTGGSFPEIGQHLGRDHSSVHHGFWLIRRRMSRDAAFRLFIREIAITNRQLHGRDPRGGGMKVQPYLTPRNLLITAGLIAAYVYLLRNFEAHVDPQPVHFWTITPPFCPESIATPVFAFPLMEMFFIGGIGWLVFLGGRGLVRLGARFIRRGAN